MRVEALLSPHNEHRILALMLVLLHAALWADFGGALSRSLMLAHLGLFLIWQPLWTRDRRLAWQGSLVFVLAAVAFTHWLNYGLMTFWLLLLTGIVGGRISVGLTDRYVHLATLLFLTAELLVACVPIMFAVQTPGGSAFRVLGSSLLVVPLVLFFIPAKRSPTEQAGSIDILNGLAMPMLASILALGSLIGTYYTGVPYTTALWQTLLAIALFLLAIGWLWTPLAGFSGLGQLWERYLLNIGTPYEHWLGELARSAVEEETPEQFLESAMHQFAELPWVAGVTWLCGERQGLVGQTTAHSFNIALGALHVDVYAERPVGAALLLHGKLLMQLVGHFYHAKEREQELTQSAHLQAIYETGARVTHDIKNLLQSLHTMTVALEESGGGVEVQRLLARQLPHLSQRLQLSLDKLQAPEKDTPAGAPLSTWWEALKSRKTGQQIRFDESLASDPLVPADFFDSVVENLLENARMKRQAEPGLDIRVSLAAAPDRTRLTVCDNGSPVDEDVATRLFKAPVKSKNGLGIGLFQAARQAQQLGYKLSLSDAESGWVCFQLDRAYPASPPHPLRRRHDRLWPQTSG